VLHGNEVEVYREESVSLYDHNKKTHHVDGIFVVTTHRVIFVDVTTEPFTTLFLPLQQIIDVSKELTLLRQKRKFCCCLLFLLVVVVRFLEVLYRF
jgi:hypothetical protein